LKKWFAKAVKDIESFVGATGTPIGTRRIKIRSKGLNMIMDSRGSSFLKICARTIARALIVAGFLFVAGDCWAQLLPGGGKFGPTTYRQCPGHSTTTPTGQPVAVISSHPALKCSTVAC
jgi:hypothetical protein